VLGAIAGALDPAIPMFRGSRPDEPRDEAVRQQLAVARWILDTADADPV
jgi:hypothetical protein